MKISVIQHPKNTRIVLIREDYLLLTKDKYCAILLSYFEYWYNIKFEMVIKNEQIKKIIPDIETESLLQFNSLESIQQDTLSTMSVPIIRRTIEKLKKMGYITTHNNPNPKYGFDRTTYYLLHPDTIQKDLDKLYNIKEEEEVHKHSSEKNYKWNRNKFQMHLKNIANASEKYNTTRTKTTEEITTENTLKEKKKKKNIRFPEKSIEFNNAFEDYLDMRKAIKKPATERAISIVFNKVCNLSTKEDIQIAIINKSILKNWTDVYALKENYNFKNKKSKKIVDLQFNKKGEVI